MFGRNKVAALVAEFLGTGVLTLIVLSVQRSTIGVPYFVALAAGLGVALLMFVFAASSGAHFNPAITIGLWTARKVQTTRAVLYIVVQLLGAWLAYQLYTYFVATTALQPIGGDFTGRVLVAEIVGAFIFSFAWAAMAYQKVEDNRAVAFVGVAFALGVIVASSASIGLINPALALGVQAWDIWGSMGWGTYVLGPVVGALLGVNLYALLFAPEDSLLKPKTAPVTARNKTTKSKR